MQEAALVGSFPARTPQPGSPFLCPALAQKKNPGGTHLKESCPKLLPSFCHPFGGGSHPAGLTAPSLLPSAFGVLPLSPIFSLEPGSATLWLRGLFLPHLATVQKPVLEEVLSAASLLGLYDKAHHCVCC